MYKKSKPGQEHFGFYRCADAFIARAQEAGAQGGDQTRITVGENAELTPEAYSFLLAAMRVDLELAGPDSDFFKSVTGSKTRNATQEGTILKVARGAEGIPRHDAAANPVSSSNRQSKFHQSRADRRQKVDTFGAAISAGCVGGRLRHRAFAAGRSSQGKKWRRK